MKKVTGNRRNVDHRRIHFAEDEKEVDNKDVDLSGVTPQKTYFNLLENVDKRTVESGADDKDTLTMSLEKAKAESVDFPPGVPCVAKPAIPANWGGEDAEPTRPDEVEGEVRESDYWDMTFILHEQEKEMKKKSRLKRSKHFLLGWKRLWKKNPAKASKTSPEFKQSRDSFDPEREFAELNRRYPAKGETIDLRSTTSRMDLSESQSSVEREYILKINNQAVVDKDSYMHPNLSDFNIVRKPKKHKTKKTYNLKDKSISLENAEERIIATESLECSDAVGSEIPGKVYNIPSETNIDSSSSDSSTCSEARCNKESFTIESPFSDFSLQHLNQDRKLIKEFKVKVVTEETAFDDAQPSTSKASYDNFDKAVANCDKPIAHKSADLWQKAEQSENLRKEDDDVIIFSWSSSDIRIGRWSLPVTSNGAGSDCGGTYCNYLKCLVHRTVRHFVAPENLRLLNLIERPVQTWKSDNETNPRDNDNLLLTSQ